ncbi:MAG: sialidase family protein [Gaiellaceae bacterium]
MMKRLFAAVFGIAIAAVVAAVAAATPFDSDVRVSFGSPTSPFSQNKQNEPAVAVNPAVPAIVAAGANDEIDMEACNNRDDKTCPFTGGVGTSGIYFSDDSGSTWMQPTYHGLTARDCLGVVGTVPSNPADNCDPHPGPIGTLPRYFENNLVSDGDPALAFGPRRGSDGTFAWANGWRLYYANLTASIGPSGLKGFEGIGVSRLDSDKYAAAKAGDSGAWHDPVIVSKQNSALFSDHEMMAVDDAALSPRFGNVYVCNAAFRGTAEVIGRGNAAPEPIVLNYSSDGGDTWKSTQLSQAQNNSQIGGRQDCAVNTDSKGNVYVFWDGTDTATRTLAIFMTVSSDGGKHFTRPPVVVTHIDETGLLDEAFGDFTIDGVAGARDGTFPTVDIANGAPSGVGATDQILLAWSDGPTPSDTAPGPNEEVRVMWSRNRGGSWTSAGIASPASDRPDMAAIAISPDGSDAYLTYDNFLQPWQSTTATERLFRGVVRHADVNPLTGVIGAWSDIHRAPTGDARGSSANALVDEFLGDYNYAFATNDFVVAAWNDARNAAVCPAINAYRQDIVNGTAAGGASDPTRPAPQQQCPATFGNTDIFGGSYSDPTP